jgi:O-antigen/teichoic acid export membrane protein
MGEGQRSKVLKSVFKGGLIVFVGNIFSKVISLLYRILVGQTGVSEYGQISVMMAVFSTALLFSQLGVPNGVQRFIAYYRGKNEEQKAIGAAQTGLKITTVSSLVTALVLFLSAPFIAQNIFHNGELTLLIQLAAIGLPFRAYSAIFMHITDSLGKMQYSVVNDKIIVNGTQLALAAALIQLGYGYIGAAVAYVSTFVLGSFVGLYFVYKVLPKVITSHSSYTNFGELFSHSWPLVIAGVFAKITSNIDTFMIQSLTSSGNVGLYQAAFPFASSLTIASGIFAGIFLSNASELISKGKMGDLASTYRTVVKWTSLTMAPMFLVLLFFPKAVLFLFGPEYYGAADVLRVLSIGFVFSGIAGPAQQIYQSMEKTKYNLYISATVGILNLSLNALLIPKIGLMGAAWASTLSLLTVAMINIYLVYKITGKQPFRFSVIKVWLAGSLSLSTVYLLNNLLFEVAPKWFYLIDVVLIAISYPLALLLLRTIEEDDLMIIEGLQEKIGYRSEKLEKIVRKFKMN